MGLVTDEAGRVEVVYKPSRCQSGRARYLTPTGDPSVEIDVGARVPEKTGPAPIPPDAIHVWTDGGCVPNPGPCGIGVVIIDGKDRRELSEYLGMGTNNIAELTAIVRGLEEVQPIAKGRTVVVYSDSQYAIGLLTQNWKPKANIELVAHLRGLLREFAEVRFVKVAAHSGIALNERVDQLATSTISRRV
jgi:ribonuclease HI